MPISGETFETSNAFANPKLLGFFVKNNNNAYALKELQEQFGRNVSWELLSFVMSGHLEQKYIENDFYYHLKAMK